MPGIDISRVVGMNEQDLDEFTCGICRDLFVDPKVTHCCRQTYCSDCINFWLRDHNTCPNDRQPLTTRYLTAPPRLVINLLNNMKIKCDFESNGCETAVELNKLSKHIDNCDYNPNKTICINCGLREDRNSEHNCVDNLRIRIDSLEVENKRLINDNSDLKREIEKLRTNTTNQSNGPTQPVRGNLLAPGAPKGLPTSLSQSQLSSIRRLRPQFPPPKQAIGLRPQLATTSRQSSHLWATAPVFQPQLPLVSNRAQIRAINPSSSGANLYIKNLDEEIFDDRRLRIEFQPFGQIISARVMYDEITNRSKGFGFVSYTTPEAAARAIAAMNDRIIGSKQLYVGLAQRRDERQQYLAQQHIPSNDMYAMGAVGGQSQLDNTLINDTDYYAYSPDYSDNYY